MIFNNQNFAPRAQDALLADATEAIIAAVFLDSGLEAPPPPAAAPSRSPNWFSSCTFIHFGPRF